MGWEVVVTFELDNLNVFAGRRATQDNDLEGTITTKVH